MAADKKISELPVISNIAASDASVLVHSGTDYQYSFTTLLEFIQAGVNPGANISFGVTLPQNTTGKNGDVFINTSAGSFAQKQSGIWTVKYTLPTSGGTADGTVLYGSGVPGGGIGSNNDTYINKDTGVFYQKAAGLWTQVFSMQTGPQGPKGDKGDTGTTGASGRTILNGTSNPSNSSIGINGDFYLNTNTYILFGPKTNGIWGPGISIVGLTGEQGDIGPKGDAGSIGEPGAGIATGGTSGQVLSKLSGDDFDTGWVDASTDGGGIVNKAAKGLLVTPSFEVEGDSIAGGALASADANGFTNIFSRLAYTKKISHANFGSGIRDVINSRFVNAPAINSKNFLLVAIGTNDIRNSNSSSNRNKVKEGIRVVLANQFLSKATAISNSGITKNGSWTNLTTANICSKASLSLGGSPMHTNVAGDTLVFSHFGDNLVVGTWGVDASHTTFGRFSVTVDGVDHGVFDMKNKADDWYLSSVNTFDIRMPNVFVLKLTSGLHSVVITALDNLEIDIDYIGRMGNPNTVAATVVGHILYSNASGYAQPPGYSSDAKVKSTNEAIDEAVQDFINMDYPVNVAKTENDLDITTAFVGTDGLHPNDSGHLQVGQSYLDTLYHIAYYKSYMQDTMRVITSNTIYTNDGTPAFVVENTDGSGQNIWLDKIGGAIAAKRRIDHAGNISNCTFGGGVHSFYVGGDFDTGQEVLRVGADGTTTVKHIVTSGHSVAALPTGSIGMRSYVTDAIAPTFLGALTGGGAVKTPVFHDGSGWVAG